MEIEIEKVVVGPLEENSYVVKVGEEGFVVDPGDEAEKIISAVERLGIKNIKYILLTHAHPDHVGALEEVKEILGGEIVMHRKDLWILEKSHIMGKIFGLNFDKPPQPDKFIEDGEEIEISGEKIKAIWVPGHTPGGVAYLFKNHLMTGDILFAGSIGRTDLPGGDFELLIHGIKTKLLTLPPETIVYPGHGPNTTIAREILLNPFLF